MANCPYCGSQIGDEAKFCPFCGAKIEAPDVRAIPEVPEAAPIPEPVAEAAIPAVPEPESVPEAVVPDAPQPEPIPAAVEPAAPQAEQPVYAQPAYAQPAYAQPIYPEQPKKKSKKWLIPVIILAALALIGIAILAFGGGSGRAASNDPNLGTYKATTVSMYGLDLDPDDIFDGGFTIELKQGGKCFIQAGDTKGNGTWKIEDGMITIKDSSSSIEGKIEDGVITVENMLDMGLDITLVKLEE